MSSFVKKAIRNSVIGLSALILANTSLYRLDQTEQAVITSFGEPVKVLLNPVAENTAARKASIDSVKAEIVAYTQKENLPMPAIDESGAGLKVKLPWQTVHYFDRRLLEWDGAPEQVPTKDKKYLFVDATCRWSISNPYVYFSTLGGVESRAHGKLDDVVDGIVREDISRRDAIESIRSTNRKMHVADKELEETVKVDSVYEGRGQISDGIARKVDAQTNTYGLKVHDFLVKRIVYVDEVRQNVEARMIAERNRIREKYISEGEGEFQRVMGEKNRALATIRSEAYRKSEDIRGRGDAEATRIYNQIYAIDPEFYAFQRSLDVMRTHAKGTTLVLDKDNQLFQYIHGGKK